MFGPRFSIESKNKIQRISEHLSRNFKPKGYEVSLYDSGSGTYSIDVTIYGSPINKFLFSAAYDNSGEIDSIAIYGQNMNMHYNEISANGQIFGLKVDHIETDCGYEPFLDVYLER